MGFLLGDVLDGEALMGEEVLPAVLLAELALAGELVLRGDELAMVLLLGGVDGLAG